MAIPPGAQWSLPRGAPRAVLFLLPRVGPQPALSRGRSLVHSGVGSLLRCSVPPHRERLHHGGPPGPFTPREGRRRLPALPPGSRGRTGVHGPGAPSASHLPPGGGHKSPGGLRSSHPRWAGFLVGTPATASGWLQEGEKTGGTPSLGTGCGGVRFSSTSPEQALGPAVGAVVAGVVPARDQTVQLGPGARHERRGWRLPGGSPAPSAAAWRRGRDPDSGTAASGLRQGDGLLRLSASGSGASGRRRIPRPDARPSPYKPMGMRTPG